MLLFCLGFVHFAASRHPNSRIGFGRHSHDENSFISFVQQDYLKSLLRYYDVAVRPTLHSITYGKGPPVVVHTSIILQSISSVDEVNMEFKTQFTLKQRWMDRRLRFVHFDRVVPSELRLADDQVVWKPDTFFQNEKSGHVHVIDKPNYAIRIRPSGEVLHDVRIAMTFSCMMNLLKYPIDVQQCSIEFASYAYTTDDIVYEWDSKPLVIDSKVTSLLPNMAVQSIVNGSCRSKTNTGEYSCLKITITFVRDFSFFAIQLYIPSSLLVAVSWVSYWIDWRASAGRMLLTIVTLLTLIQQSYSISANLPPVSYAKAADIWIGGCVFFVFVSLLEYAVINFLGIQYELRKWKPYTTIGGYLSRLHGVPALSLRRVSRAFHKRNSRARSAQSASNAFLTEPYFHDDAEASSRRGTAEWCPQSSLTRRRRRTEQRHIGFASAASPLLEDSSLNVAMVADTDSEEDIKNTPEIIDKVFRVIIPGAFVLFNAAYWSVYK